MIVSFIKLTNMAGTYELSDGRLYYKPLDPEISKRFDRERQEQIKYEVQCRIQENYQFAVESYTRLFEMEVWERPENWWKIDWVASAMRSFFFKIEDHGYGKPVIVPRRVEATVLHLCKDGRTYRLSLCVKECWCCGGVSPGCGRTPPSN